MNITTAAADHLLPITWGTDDTGEFYQTTEDGSDGDCVTISPQRVGDTPECWLMAHRDGYHAAVLVDRITARRMVSLLVEWLGNTRGGAA